MAQPPSKRVQQQPPQAQQQPQPAQVQQPVPRQVEKQEDSVPVLFEEMEGWFQRLKRDLSAFNALNMSYLTVVGQLPPGERARGLPIFEFKAPGPDGREAITCTIDVKKVNPQFQPHVLVPMINTVAGDMLEAVEEVGSRVQMLIPRLRAMVASDAVAPREDDGEGEG